MNAPDDFAECQSCRCAAARRQAHKLTRRYDAALRPHDLNIEQFTLLVNLIVGGPTPIALLAERLGLERTTLTRNLAVVSKRGWIDIMRGEDQRERVVVILLAGQQKADDARPAWKRAQAAA
ncbi:DNA-binding MarR family transcriptional regulator [Devosia sp. UYZn731]|uniref:MarR family winged helix-turn-helix transcriptional regulator n=1 Tax=Devosia sp. UYZn731 TaxID=3156345 RepID=UPI00339208CB